MSKYLSQNASTASMATNAGCTQSSTNIGCKIANQKLVLGQRWAKLSFAQPKTGCNLYRRTKNGAISTQACDKKPNKTQLETVA